jgi:ABC-2 type transport system permease protein
MIDLVAAEGLKLRTTRLLLGMIPAAVAISLAGVAGTVLVHGGGDRAVLESAKGVRQVLSATGAGAILVLVVGIIISAGEYRYGTADDTFLTTPRRHQVLAAKLAVGSGLGLAVGVVTSLASIGIAAVLYSTEGATFPLDDAEVWLTLAGTLVYTALFAMLGVALGSLVRNQVLAVTGALAWFAVVEHALVNLAPDVGRWLPAAAGQAIIRTPLDGLLSPLAGTALLATYAVAIALSGIRVAATRDA